MLLVLAACGSPTPSTSAPTSSAARRYDHVVVISIDGLLPATYTEPDAHDLRVPTLRALAAGGARSPGVHGVLPTVTYPSHTTMVTGVRPAAHGITTNTAFDPMLKNYGGWRWYVADIRVPTLWDAARAAGLRTAAVNWPVTVGAGIDLLVPEYWRAYNPEDTKLVRALSTPGLPEEIEHANPGLWQRYQPWEPPDDAVTDVAVHLIATHRPNLLLVHLWAVDTAQHNHGLGSAEAKAAIEHADAQVARLLDALHTAGLADRAAVVVVSDHGFAPTPRRMRPGVVLRELGQVELDEAGRVTAWRAAPATDGGNAYLYAADSNDEATRRRVHAAFAALAGAPDSGILRLLPADAIRASGGDPDAFLALEAAADYAFEPGYTGPVTYPTTGAVAHHGFAADRADMKSSLILSGRDIAPGVLEEVRLIDLAPTLAAWLGLPLADAEGTPLR
jgi:predicted AlkP superfamily pyrophosphatase or phosphodiesterase